MNIKTSKWGSAITESKEFREAQMQENERLSKKVENTETFRWVKITPLDSGYLVECEMKAPLCEGSFPPDIRKHGFALYSDVEKFLLEHMSPNPETGSIPDGNVPRGLMK